MIWGHDLGGWRLECVISPRKGTLSSLFTEERDRFIQSEMNNGEQIGGKSAVRIVCHPAEKSAEEVAVLPS